MTSLEEQCRAKDKVISSLLDACSFLLKEYEKSHEAVPQHIYDALLFDEPKQDRKNVVNENQGWEISENQLTLFIKKNT